MIEIQMLGSAVECGADTVEARRDGRENDGKLSGRQIGLLEQKKRKIQRGK